MGFLKSLFGGSKKSIEPTEPEPKQLDSLPFEQVLEYMQSFKDSMPSTVFVAIHKRLYEIALYDHHVEQQTREQALNLLDVLNKHSKVAFAENQKLMDSLDEASKFMVENARFMGVGSLGWLMEEHNVTNAETIPFMMKPEYGHLLADFLEVLGAEPLAKVKDGLVKHLILSRRYNGCSNAVLTLHGLATKGDLATIALFNEAELAVLVGVPDDYAAGRQLLVNLGLLPSESSAFPFVPVKDKGRLIQLMTEVYKERDASVKADSRITGAGQDRQDILQSALAIQRLHLIRRMIGQIHGQDMSQALLEVLSDGPTRDISMHFDDVMSKLEDAPAGTLIDLMLLAHFMELGGMAIETEEDYLREQAWMEMGAAWLNSERVEVLNYTRYLLRWDPENLPPSAKTEADESISNFVLKTYYEQGAKAGLAEQMMPSLEDWIGLDS